MNYDYDGFTQKQMTFGDTTRTVYRGGTGPAVIVMHEVPGLYPGIAKFGRTLMAEGYTVFMPSLVGTPGKEPSTGYMVKSLARACIAREFTVWATGQNSPITNWLRELASYAHKECKGPGVGAIGMCLTGGFALAMAVDPCLVAPVLSQPSLPFAVTAKQKRDLGIDESTLARVKERSQSETLCVLGLRFTEDPLVPSERFARLREELGDNFLAVEIDSSKGNPHGFSQKAHSVLVLDHKDEPGSPTREARQRVSMFLHERLHSLFIFLLMVTVR